MGGAGKKYEGLRMAAVDFLCVFVFFSEEYPCVFSLSLCLSSPFSKDFMYTAFMLFCLMKIV